MGNTLDLQALREKREEILKAELFMLLHDIGKLHVGHQAKYIRDDKKGDYQHPLLGPPSTPGLNVLPNLGRISIQRKQFSLIAIVKNHHRPSGYATRLAQQIDWLDSEYDREWVPSGPKYIQPISLNLSYYDIFGYTHGPLNIELSRRNSRVNCTNPTDSLEKLLCLVVKLPFAEISRDKIRRKWVLDVIRYSFLKAAGDTRFSVNEISLWDHSWSTAIMFKIFLTNHILLGQHFLTLDGNMESRKQIFRQWFRPQLLPLRIDGLGYLSQSNNVPDLLARRKLLQQVYDTWKDILEWEFPLAGEVYRDENGPVFLTFLRDKEGKGAITLKQLSLPPRDEKDGGEDKINPVLASAYNQAKNLEEYLRQSVIHLTQGDLTLPPEIPLPTYTQKRSSKEDEKSLGDLLREEQNGLWLHADKQCLHLAWKRLQRRSTKGEEICTTCGLRPQGFGRWYVLEGTEEKKLALDEWSHHYRNNHNPKKKWEEKTEEERKCLVCKAISRSMCGVCLERREERAKPWAQGVHLSGEERFLRGLPETVWLDEVADKNGRIALIVGYFPIEHWLDGLLIESLAMFKDKRKIQLDAQNRQITLPRNRRPVLGPKPVSYSRIRRVWETTRRFWQDVAPTEAPSEDLRKWLEDNEPGLELRDLWDGPLSLAGSLAGKVIVEKEKGLRPRLFLKGSVQNGSLGPYPYHAYELEIQGRKVAVLWVPEDAKDDKGNALPYRGGFWVIENLDYLDKVYGRSFQNLVQNLVGRPLQVYEPTEYGRPGQEQDTFAIAQENDVQYLENAYTPLIPILAEPRTFIALVPAESAFDVLQAIKAKYEQEMGRVRNRLPLHLGVVFADAHQPLRTLLDAGSRMLKQKEPALLWEVRNIKRFGQPNNPNETKGWRALRLLKQQGLLAHHPNQFRVMVGVHLRNNGRELIWHVPAVMGDGQTEDHWYPYVLWEQDKKGNTEPEKATVPRTRYYKADLGNPWNPAHPWLVHAAELQPGDRIYFTPATFDFLWLDHGGRRFEITYDEHGHRRGTLHRPYLLDELLNLQRCWNLLDQGLGARQIHQVRDLIETRRAQWFPDDPGRSLSDPTFRQFCVAVLRNAEWHTPPPEADMKRLIQWAVDGTLADAVELFYHIMKISHGDTGNPGP